MIYGSDKSLISIIVPKPHGAQEHYVLYLGGSLDESGRVWKRRDAAHPKTHCQIQPIQSTNIKPLKTHYEIPKNKKTKALTD